MPITFNCPCGQALAAHDEHAGLPVRCPACGQTPVAPYQLWDGPADAPQAAPAPARPTAVPTSVNPRPWEKQLPLPEPDATPADPNNPFGFTSPGDSARERDRQVREREAGGDTKTAGRSLEGGVLNGGVAGGMIAMLVAVIWFVVGLAADMIFFYPPILFIIGLIAFFKGLMQGPESGA